MKGTADKKAPASLDFNEHRLHDRMLVRLFSISSNYRFDPIIRPKARDIIDFIHHEIMIGNASTNALDCNPSYTKTALAAEESQNGGQTKRIKITISPIT